MYQVWDGDLFMFTVEDSDEADMYIEAGFSVKSSEYYGA